MIRTRRPHRRSKLALALPGAGLALVALLAGHSPTAEAADDIDLLRKKGGQPYVFFLVDTSGSMVLDEDDNWVAANGDDPDSKIFQIKKALYEVMSGVESVHFGLASFNQDRLQVQSKHWLYRADAAGDLGPFDYPSAAGEVWTFGRHVDPTGAAGTCTAPLSLSAARLQLNRFARLGLAGLETTTLWVSDGGEDYRLQISLAPGSPGGLGSPEILVRVEARTVIKCSPPEVAVQPEVAEVRFRLETDFLMVESNGVPSAADGDNCTSNETMKSVWPYTDVLAQNTCGSGSSAPFTGRGWEGNTDSGDRPPWPPSPPDSAPPAQPHDDLDECCVATGAPGVCLANPGPADVCYNLRSPTDGLHPDFDELDKGDMIPLHWEVDYKDEFLRRLNPLHPSYPPRALWDGEPANGEASQDDFRPFFSTASYFQDQPDAVTGLLQLKSEQQRPLVAFGNSPLGRAINDFRCWYLGDDGGKCKGPSFDPGWEAVFRDNDLEYGCRVPYLIIISDGEDNSKGENPSADTANLFSKSGVRTFAFTFNSTSQLHSIVQNGKGELILVDDGDDLARKLREIIGFIEEESRTFASAAVPSVQAAVEDKIYLTEFTPLDQAGAWDGHVHSFLKPLPLDPLSGRPDTTDENHLWDAASVMLQQSPAPVAGDTSAVDLQVGDGLDQRRVYYAGEPDRQAIPAESWVENRRLFTRSTDPGENGLTEPAATAEEADLWDGLGLLGGSYDPDNPDSVQETRKEAFGIIERTLIQRTYNSTETGLLTYILGDIFHSDPLVIRGGPGAERRRPGRAGVRLSGVLPDPREPAQDRRRRGERRYAPRLGLRQGGDRPHPRDGRHLRHRARRGAVRQRLRPRALRLHPANRPADGQEPGQRLREPPVERRRQRRRGRRVHRPAPRRHPDPRRPRMADGGDRRASGGGLRLLRPRCHPPRPSDDRRDRPGARGARGGAADDHHPPRPGGAAGLPELRHRRLPGAATLPGAALGVHRPDLGP
jgi:hypothetical protein